MGLFHKPQKQDFPDLPDNLYLTKLAKITHKVGKESGKPYISWGFEIVQPPFQKRWVWANTPLTIGPKSIAGKFLTSLGIDISTVDENFNEQTLVGRYIKVLVETSENDDGVKFQNVTKLLGLTETDEQLLQQWLSQANVKGQVNVVSSAPVVTPPQPVPAAAPVSYPQAPASFPGFAPAPAPVAQPQPAPAVATPTKKFPF